MKATSTIGDIIRAKYGQDSIRRLIGLHAKGKEEKQEFNTVGTDTGRFDCRDTNRSQEPQPYARRRN